MDCLPRRKIKQWCQTKMTNLEREDDQAKSKRILHAQNFRHEQPMQPETSNSNGVRPHHSGAVPGVLRDVNSAMGARGGRLRRARSCWHDQRSPGRSHSMRRRRCGRVRQPASGGSWMAPDSWRSGLVFLSPLCSGMKIWVIERKMTNTLCC